MSMPLREARNLGRLTAAELESVGVSSLSVLRSLGWEEVFERWVQVFPERINLNACTALIGALEDLDWRDLPADLQAQARAFVSGLRSAS